MSRTYQELKEARIRSNRCLRCGLPLAAHETGNCEACTTYSRNAKRAQRLKARALKEASP